MSEIKLTGVPNFNGFEIVKTGKITVSLTAPDTQATNFAAHNLGYAPAYLAYLDDSGGTDLSQLPLTLFATTAGLMLFDVYVDTVNITARITKENNDSNNNEITVRFYLLRETAR